MEKILVEVLGVILLAVAYFLLQTYTAKKSRVPKKLNNPEFIPVIENQNNQEEHNQKVSFEDLVGEMTNEGLGEEAHEEDLNQQFDTQMQEEGVTSESYSKLEQEIIRLGQIVEDLDKKVSEQEKKPKNYHKKLFEDSASVKKAFVFSEIMEPKFKAKPKAKH